MVALHASEWTGLDLTVAGIPPVLASKRLKLRMPTMDDAGQIVPLANNLNVAKQLRTMPHPYGPADAEGYVRMAQSPDGSAICRLITDHAGTVLGAIGAHRQSHGQYELGYWLGEPYWGQGYMVEAAQTFIEALTRAGIILLHAGHAEDNLASARVLIRCGFLYTGVRETQPCKATGRARAVRMMIRFA